MRLALPVLLLSATALAGCGTTGSMADGADRFGDGVVGAATAPMDDLNLRRQEIPEILTVARGAPYDLQGLGRCADIGAEITRLEEVLGPDIDDPASGEAEAMSDQAANIALDAVRDTTTDFIPFRSWVRRLSGATRHEREVQASVQAGQVRRAFLKGVGRQRNCAPPAAPYGFRPAS